MVRDKWQLDNFHGDWLAAHDGVHAGAHGGVLRTHIGHGNGLVQHGAEQTAGDFAQALAGQTVHFRVFTHRHTLQAQQAHAHARECARRARKLRQHAGRAGEPAGACTVGTSHFLHGPIQGPFHRRGGGVQIIAIQAQAGFQAQGIACTQANGFDFGLRQQRARQRLGVGRWHRNLEAVFAGVTTARDEQRRALPGEVATGHEHQLAYPWQQARQRRHGQRPLQSQQRVVGHGQHLAALADARLDVRNVAHPASPIDHHKNFINATAEEHQVVDDAARVVEQQTVALLARWQVDHVNRHQGFKRGCSIGADQAQLAHVRDVKQSGRLSGLVMFGHQAAGVLHGHGVAGKRHHASAQLQVQRMQGCLQEFSGGCGHGSGTFQRQKYPKKGANHVVTHALPRCPLYLRDSPGDAGLLLRWTALKTASLQ